MRGSLAPTNFHISVTHNKKHLSQYSEIINKDFYFEFKMLN